MARSRRFWIAAAVIVAAIVVAGVSTVLITSAWRDEKADVAQDRTDEAEAVIGAKAAIAARMPQAQSISFGKVLVRWTGTIPSVCGEVDVVEPQDSFEGPERFIYSEGDLTLEEVDGSDAVSQKWDDLCK